MKPCTSLNQWQREISNWEWEFCCWGKWRGSERGSDQLCLSEANATQLPPGPLDSLTAGRSLFLLGRTDVILHVLIWRQTLDKISWIHQLSTTFNRNKTSFHLCSWNINLTCKRIISTIFSYHRPPCSNLSPFENYLSSLPGWQSSRSTVSPALLWTTMTGTPDFPKLQWFIETTST